MCGAHDLVQGIGAVYNGHQAHQSAHLASFDPYSSQDLMSPPVSGGLMVSGSTASVRSPLRSLSVCLRALSISPGQLKYARNIRHDLPRTGKFIIHKHGVQGRQTGKLKTHQDKYFGGILLYIPHTGTADDCFEDSRLTLTLDDLLTVGKRPFSKF